MDHEKRKFYEHGLFNEIKLYEYICRSCDNHWIPHSRNPKRNHELPVRCPKCHSSTWQIPAEFTEKCIRCGYAWDRRFFDRIPKKCPFCKARNYTRAQWEEEVNYKQVAKGLEEHYKEKAIHEKKMLKLMSKVKVKYKKRINVDDIKSRLNTVDKLK